MFFAVFEIFQRKETTYPEQMLITFWCDCDITCLHRLLKKIGDGTVFSIINVFWLLNICGADRDASFDPRANLVIAVIDLKG